MTPEERLDRLLELREQGAPRLPMTSEDIAARVAAADALARLQAIDAPPEVDARLEARIRARARQLARQNGEELPVPRPLEHSHHAHWFLLRRAWVTALGMAAVLILLCVGILAAAASSLPGDPLYSLKQFEHQVRLSFASDQQNRAELAISQLHSGLADLSTVIDERRGDDAIQQGLDAVAAETRESQAAVASVPAGTEQAAQRDLASALAEEEQTLRSGLAHVDWPLRLAFTQQLGALGEAVPTITRVDVQHPSTSTVTITLTGTNFASGALLTINGIPKGSVSKNAPTTLVVALNASDWPKGQAAVGVQNPDGTAAQITHKAGGDDNDQDGDDQPRQGTPGATSTPGGNDREDDGGGSRGSPTPTSPPRSGGTPTSPPDH